MIIFHILVCVWMCFCLAFPRQEPIFQPVHSSPTATSTGSPRLSERGWRTLPLENQGAPPHPPRLSDRVTGAPDTRQRAQGLWLWCCCCGGKEGRDPSSVLPAAGYLSDTYPIFSFSKEKIGKKSQTMQVESERKEQKTRGEQGVGGKDGGS